MKSLLLTSIHCHLIILPDCVYHQHLLITCNPLVHYRSVPFWTSFSALFLLLPLSSPPLCRSLPSSVHLRWPNLINLFPLIIIRQCSPVLLFTTLCIADLLPTLRQRSISVDKPLAMSRVFIIHVSGPYNMAFSIFVLYCPFICYILVAVRPWHVPLLRMIHSVSLLTLSNESFAPF